MISSRLRVQSGFTLWEVVVAAAMLLLGISVYSSVMNSADLLAKDSNLHTHVAREHRRNLHAIANHLSNAVIDSLEGFGVDGTATECTFQRVVAQDADGPIFGGPETIAWAPTVEQPPVDGKPVGRVTLSQAGGGATLLADRVPQGTFFVRQEGRNLVVHLCTYYRTTEDRLVQLTSETSVMLRN